MTITTADQEIFDQLIDIHRYRADTSGGSGSGDIGLGPYSGPDATTSPSDVEGEDVLFTNIPAAVMAISAGRVRGPLPADVVYKPAWEILIPESSGVPKFAIRDRDIVIDDDGYRYAVQAAEWTPLGWNLRCIRLEV